MRINQKRFWSYQISFLLFAGFIALFLWRLFPGELIAERRLFYFPDLFCEVSFCVAQKNVLPFAAHYFFIIMLTLYLLILFSFTKFSRKHREILKQESYNPWMAGLVVIFFLSAGWEGIARTRSFLKNDAPLWSETISAQYKSIHPYAYSYAQKVKAVLPIKYLEAELVSDTDFSKTPGMLRHRALSYFLYPINIRLHYPGRKPDVLLLFEKKDAIKHIPDNYKVLYIIDRENIIALKK